MNHNQNLMDIMMESIDRITSNMEAIFPFLSRWWRTKLTKLPIFLTSLIFYGSQTNFVSFLTGLIAHKCSNIKVIRHFVLRWWWFTFRNNET